MNDSPARPRRTLRYRIGSLYLKLFGWSAVGAKPEGRKFVIIAAPHTSNWDLPFTLACSYVLDVKISFLMKHTWFKEPFGTFFRWLGGVPVDRTARNNLVEQCVQAFREREELVLAVPPEGTRSKTQYWKTGFYWIANGAQVPILLGFLDFKNKEGGLGPAIMPTGDLQADLARIRAFYSTKTGKHPELTGPIEVRPEPAPEDQQKPVSGR